MTITIRPVSTIEFIGLSETNTIGYYKSTTRKQGTPAGGSLRRVTKAHRALHAVDEVERSPAYTQPLSPRPSFLWQRGSR